MTRALHWKMVGSSPAKFSMQIKRTNTDQKEVEIKENSRQILKLKKIKK